MFFKLFVDRLLVVNLNYVFEPFFAIDCCSESTT
jgi:hypothetical protein